MRAAAGGLNRSKMAAPNQGAEDRSVSAERETSAAVPGAAPTVFLAIELSQASWIVAVHSPATARASLHRLPAGDAKALLALAERARTAAVEATGEAVAVASCYEAGYDGFWLHRVLVAAGIASLVVDPASLKVDHRARRAKTDRPSMSWRLCQGHRCRPSAPLRPQLSVRQPRLPGRELLPQPRDEYLWRAARKGS